MASPDFGERRLCPRAAVALDLRLERPVGNPVSARTRDLGVYGAQVVSRRPLRIDEELRFDLELPPGGRHLTGTARVVRQDLVDQYALRFERVAPEDERALSGFVDAHGQRV